MEFNVTLSSVSSTEHPRKNLVAMPLRAALSLLVRLR
jgi:hypothetical protein